MKWSRALLFVVTSGLIFAASALSQVKKGQVGFRFLENPVSAEAIGRGGLGLVLLQNSNTVFWNPAGLGWIDSNFDINLNYTKGIANINNSSFAGAVKIANFAVVALDVLVMDYGDFAGTRRANNDQGFIDTGTFSPQAYALGFSFCQLISDRFSYGVRIKYASQDLGNAWVGISGTDVDDPALQIAQKSYGLDEFAFDVGAIYDFNFHKIRFGAAIQNVSREIKYEEEKFPLPFAASFSLSLAPLSFFKQEQIPLIVGFETRHPRDFKEKFKVGAEYQYKNLLILRSGYMGNYDERGLTLGLGVCTTVHKEKIRFDYAFQDFGIFNSVHTFSFGMMF